MNIINNLLFLPLARLTLALLLPQRRLPNRHPCIPLPSPLFPDHLSLPRFRPKPPPHGFIDDPFPRERTMTRLL